MRTVVTGLPDPALRPPAPLPLLVSMSDIATFARVKRPVVSTWRRRHPDFPAAVSESSGRPLFDGAQVTDRLIASGLGNASPTELRSELALFAIIDATGPARTAADRRGRTSDQGLDGGAEDVEGLGALRAEPLPELRPSKAEAPVSEAARAATVVKAVAPRQAARSQSRSVPTGTASSAAMARRLSPRTVASKAAPMTSTL